MEQKILNVLFVGDVAGQESAEKLGGFLPRFKRGREIGLTVVNGENSADGNGITPYSAKTLFNGGADVITTGNHAFKRKETDVMYRERAELLRPLNFGADCPGRGIIVIDFGGFSVAVVNLIGSAFMPPCDNPFKCADELLAALDVKNIIVDFHAEATAEKKAMAYHLSGRVSAVIGTHTHVQTADEQIMGDHTAFITDAGMTGAADSVIGAEKTAALLKFTSYYPVKFTAAAGKCEINAVIVSIDVKSGRALSVERIKEDI